MTTDDKRRQTLLQLPFPLIGGGMAVLNVPIPLSLKNYEYLTALMSRTLADMKDAIVTSNEEDEPKEQS